MSVVAAHRGTLRERNHLTDEQRHWLRKIDKEYPDKTKLPAGAKSAWLSMLNRAYGDAGTAAASVEISAIALEFASKEARAKGGKNSSKERRHVMSAMLSTYDGKMKRSELWEAMGMYTPDSPWIDDEADARVYMDYNVLVEVSIDRSGSTSEAAILRRTFNKYFLKIKSERTRS